jgi:hypothetical protein
MYKYLKKKEKKKRETSTKKYNMQCFPLTEGCKQIILPLKTPQGAYSSYAEKNSHSIKYLNIFNWRYLQPKT